jgi:hypothetical protein
MLTTTRKPVGGIATIFALLPLVFRHNTVPNGKVGRKSAAWVVTSKIVPSPQPPGVGVGITVGVGVC